MDRFNIERSPIHAKAVSSPFQWLTNKPSTSFVQYEMSESLLFRYKSGHKPELFQLFSRIILLSSISDYVTFCIAYIIYYEYNVY